MDGETVILITDGDTAAHGITDFTTHGDGAATDSQTAGTIHTIMVMEGITVTDLTDTIEATHTIILEEDITQEVM